MLRLKNLVMNLLPIIAGLSFQYWWLTLTAVIACGFVAVMWMVAPQHVRHWSQQRPQLYAGLRVVAMLAQLWLLSLWPLGMAVLALANLKGPFPDAWQWFALSVPLQYVVMWQVVRAVQAVRGTSPQHLTHGITWFTVGGLTPVCGIVLVLGILGIGNLIGAYHV